jgi:hypothetical protein
LHGHFGLDVLYARQGRPKAALRHFAAQPHRDLRLVVADIDPDVGKAVLGKEIALHRDTGRIKFARSGFLPGLRLGPVLPVRPLAQLPAGNPDLRTRAAWNASVGDLEIF